MLCSVAAPPAASPSKTSTTSLTKPLSSPTCCSVNAVPKRPDGMGHPVPVAGDDVGIPFHDQRLLTLSQAALAKDKP